MPKSVVMVVLGKDISSNSREEAIKGVILQICIFLCEWSHWSWLDSVSGKLFVESDHRMLESKCYLIHCLTCKHTARGTDQDMQGGRGGRGGVGVRRESNTAGEILL